MGRPQHIDRDAVLDAAEQIVLRRGAAALTIDAVATAAGITKGGVQYCFGAKRKLVQAMVERWCRNFQAQIEAFARPHDDPISMVAGYVEATARIDKVGHARAAGLIAMLLETPSQMELVRAWYHDHFQKLDMTTPEGRRARIVFMAIEGAFMLRTFGFMRMGEQDWKTLFDDIKAMLPRPSRKTAKANG